MEEICKRVEEVAQRMENVALYGDEPPDATDLMCWVTELRKAITDAGG